MPQVSRMRASDSRSNFVQQEVARYLTDGIAHEEDSGNESELLTGDGQLFVHGHGGEANVDSVEKLDNIEEQTKGRIRTFSFRIVLALMDIARVAISIPTVTSVGPPNEFIARDF
jgi:hypothetical protein